jgi:regulator of protease activity HflC (stomatin/prohibitin superfamily)
MEPTQQKGCGITALVIGIVVLIVIILWGWPVYNVWQQKLAGEAALARANQQRQILVAQARAEKEAAELRADAIKIVGAAATEYPQYRIQEFIGAFAEAMNNGKIEKIIYVPTEANIPIVEAGKR